jgi:shikimate kinase
MAHGNDRAGHAPDGPARSVAPTGPTLVFLIGPRGSGKTTVARLLAAKLGWGWLDADDLVERRHGKSIRELFAAEGEVGFRNKEAAILAEICELQHQVVATGGGVVLRPENRQLLQRSGWCVWLTADAATLWQRMQADPATPERRPQLASGGLAEIAEVLAARAELYRGCAHAIVPTGDRPPERVVNDVLERIADCRLQIAK